MALTPEEEKRLAELQARKNRQTRVNKSTQEEIDNLLARQSQKLSDQLKLAKQNSQAEQEHEKILKSSEKSLSSILGHLVKGNVAQASNEIFSKKAGAATKIRSEAHKDITKHLKDSNTYASLSSDHQAKIRETIAGINTGMYGQAELAATLEDIGAERVKDTSILGQLMVGLVELSEDEADAKEETERVQKIINQELGKAAGIFAGLVALAKSFGDRLDKIGDTFGSLVVLGKEFRTDLLNSSVEATKLGGGIAEVASISNVLASNFGMTLQDSIELSSKIFDTSKALGLSADEGANLFGVLTQTANLSGEQAERLTEGAFQLAAMNRVNPSAVLKDMAGSSEAFAMFSEDGGDNLAKAAIQARALGLSLDTTSKIAEGLLDFEQSITKEVEASVLIGRQLNFQKARELALNNDIEGAITNVVSQLGSEAEFNRLNSIQRKAIADSIGVSVADMAKMVANQGKSNILAGETAKSFQDIIGKDAMSELTAVLNELKIFGVAIANILGPPLMGLAKLVNFVLTPLGNAVVGLSGGIRGVDDFRSGPGGITTMAGPAGVFRLNPRDSVLATTNPIPVNDFMTGPPGSMGGNSNVSVSVGGKISGRDIVFFQEQGAEFGDAPGNGLM